jgi:transcriptional regulator with XRE-family HTH domain
MRRNPRIGSAFDDFLREEGALEEVEARTQKRVLARQLERLMRDQRLSKARLAQRMRTSRSALDRLLDPTNASVTLRTLTSAARALGTRLVLRLSRTRAKPAQPRSRSRPSRAATA